MKVLVIGAGMIVGDQILASLYQCQRLGKIDEITICGTRRQSLKALKDRQEILEAFPSFDFKAMPDPNGDSDASGGDLYFEAMKELPPRSFVIVALPDQLHYKVVMDVLKAGHHVLCVKPLVLTYAESEEIIEEARKRALYVGVEYHKRFDRRWQLARRDYRSGKYGEFITGEAKLIEPWYYRESNFQNWFTCEETDPFIYIGCHYVDMVTFVTGLMPTEIASKGVRLPFPNGKEAFMWASTRVGFENGAQMNLLTGLGYPDEGAGTNEQCASLFFEAKGRTGLIRHNDQFRGVEHGFGGIESGKRFVYVSPDYMKLVPFNGEGLAPVGYGYESIAGHLDVVIELEKLAGEDKEKRRTMLLETDERGFMATAANSSYNELVCEAGRLSILNEGKTVKINYGEKPGIALAE